MTARAQKEYMDYCIITQGHYNSGKEDGITQGIATGEARGEERAKFENARNLLLAKLGTSEQIATALNLSPETVRQLAKQLKAEPVQVQ